MVLGKKGRPIQLGQQKSRFLGRTDAGLRRTGNH